MKALKKTIALILALVLVFGIASCAGEIGPKGDKGEKGDKGDAGSTVTLLSLEKTKTEGVIDTYTMTFSDGTKHNFAIYNGNDGENGITPEIGENGNWFIGDEDTGISAEGAAGENGLTPEIGENGNWFIGDEDTGISARGEKGEAVTITSIAKVPTSNGLVDTYTILTSDGKNFNFQVTNGEKGDAVSVTSIEKTKTEGLVDTYTITYSDGSEFDFTVTNGKDAESQTVNIVDIVFNEGNSTTDTYKINYSDESYSTFTVTKSGDVISEVASAYEEAAGRGYKGSLNDFVIEAATKAQTTLLTPGSVLGAKTLGAAMTQLLAKYNTYYVTNIERLLLRKVAVEGIIYGYLGADGKHHDSTGYKYNNTPIAVSEGESVKLTDSNNNYYGFRFLTAYNGTSAVNESGVVDTGSHTKEYLVPSGIDGLKITYTPKTGVTMYAEIYANTVWVEAATKLDIPTVNILVNGTMGGGAGTAVKDSDTEIAISAVLGSPSILMTAKTLASEQVLWLTGEDKINTILNNKNLTLTCNFEGTLGAGQSIRLGHGTGGGASSYIIIDDTNIIVYSSDVLRATIAHGLTLTDYINVTIDANVARAKITLATGSGMYQTGEVIWCGRDGQIFATPTGVTISDVKMRWMCEGYGENVWLYGDSYFDTTYDMRWPYYLIKAGYDNCMLSGYPGMNTQTALSQFKIDIERGTPQYVVWCVGMNNGDPDASTPQQAWLDATTEFLEICNAKGITPILTTTPSTPTVSNYAKSEWVRNSGYRYVDFSRAVGGDQYSEKLVGKEYTKPNGQTETNSTGNEWYPDMLYGDLVHPDSKGAAALYAQLIADFPEIMRQD